MVLAPSVTTAARNAAADVVTALVDAGSAAGRLRIYSGTPPVDVNAALGGGTLLADLAMSDPAFGPAVAGVAPAGPIADDLASASGTATHFRVGAWDGFTFTPVMQGSVGTSGCDLNLSSVAIAPGAQVSIGSLTYTQAGGS